MIKRRQILFFGSIAIAIILLYGYVKTGYNNVNRRNADTELEYYGVVQEMRIDTLSRGTPKFLINGEWVYLGTFGRSIRSLVMAGDSISKTQGRNYLLLYRREGEDGYKLLKKVESW